MATKEKKSKEVRALEQQLKRAIKDKDKQIEFFEMITDSLTEAITPLEFKVTKFPIQLENGQEEEEVCLLLSDLHFGKKSKGYNLNVAAKRFEEIVAKAIKMVKE